MERRYQAYIMASQSGTLYIEAYQRSGQIKGKVTDHS